MYTAGFIGYDLVCIAALQGIKYWVMLLFPLGRLRVPPRCGWTQF